MYRHFVKDELPRVVYNNPSVTVDVQKKEKAKDEQWDPELVVEHGTSCLFRHFPIVFGIGLTQKCPLRKIFPIYAVYQWMAQLIRSTCIRNTQLSFSLSSSRYLTPLSPPNPLYSFLPVDLA